MGARHEAPAKVTVPRKLAAPDNARGAPGKLTALGKRIVSETFAARVSRRQNLEPLHVLTLLLDRVRKVDRASEAHSVGEGVFGTLATPRAPTLLLHRDRQRVGQAHRVGE